MRWLYPQSSVFLIIRLFQPATICIVWARAAPTVSQESARIPTPIPTEEGLQYLAACRWPEGFVCPRCGHRRGLRGRDSALAMRRVSASGVADRRHVLHNTKTPLTQWFWAAYLMTTDKRGVSALFIQRQLGLRRYDNGLDDRLRSRARMRGMRVQVWQQQSRSGAGSSAFDGPVTQG